MDEQRNEAQPLVSFIIPYHNEPVEMLEEGLKSILALSLSDKEREIIIIDDGSDKSPLDELYKYEDLFIYARQPNRGPSEARNLGITLSHGRYIQFVDADDYLIRQGYEHCLDIMRFQMPDMVLFNFTHETGDVDTPYLFDGPMSGTEFMTHNNIKASPCCYLFKKKLLLNLKFTPGLLHEDEEFTPRLIIRAEKLYKTDTIAYFYRVRSDSTMHKKNSDWTTKRLDDAEYIIKKLNRLADTMPTDERVAMQRRVAQFTMDYIYNTIMITRSSEQLEERVERLRSEGLFPLPDQKYTHKYQLFRRMTLNKTGRKLLLRTLPFWNSLS